ncbi:hypothetical protein [Marinobacterium marinum]|uniref:DUF3325 domain-containing protein n=1 Tax=Marinobacterium marinum TaxID=2756129 RepID=A0A7W1WZS7_9GAMM|nr:hypothetical protein [Marinobacterium marinum]MBA4503253.1 hypothetical protein [Marinobacterium marinum]
MVHLLVLTLSVAGFHVLAMTTGQGAWRHRPVLYRLGWCLLWGALIVASVLWGGGLGVTLGVGYLSAGAGLVFMGRIVVKRYGR